MENLKRIIFLNQGGEEGNTKQFFDLETRVLDAVSPDDQTYEDAEDALSRVTNEDLVVYNGVVAGVGKLN